MLRRPSLEHPLRHRLHLHLSPRAVWPVQVADMSRMLELPAYFSKKVFFLLFNLSIVIMALVTGTLRWDVSSIVGGVITLLFMNWMALIASRRYKGKYKGW